MLLETESLSKEFSGFTAIDEVSLSVPEGEIRSIIGPNGAGKTTLFNLLMGTFSPSTGRISFKGEDITNEPAHARPYLGMSRSYQITNIYSNKTASENLQTAVGLFESNYYDMFRPLMSRQSILQYTEQLLDQLNLAELRDERAGALSHGDKRRLEIGMALASDPELLLLDEPTAGMGSREAEQMINFVEELASEITILLVEHDIESVMRVSDTISVLERGGVIAEGTPSEIRQNERVQEAYLGY